MPKSEQGVNRDRYLVIPRTLVFITRGEEVLLIKGAPTKRLWANRYNGVGGHVERGENVGSAALREVCEETGLDVRNMRLCGTVMVDASDEIGIAIYVFRAEYAGGEIIPSDEGALEWIRAERLHDLPVVDDLRVILPQVLRHEAGDVPFHARSYYDAQDRLQVEISSSSDD